MLSKYNALLPRRWNSGLLRLLMECPRKLLLGGIQGWRTREESAHLDFGSMLQEAQDTFLRARLAGARKEEATLRAVERALQISGWYDTLSAWKPRHVGHQGIPDGEPEMYKWHPWGGTYETMWRCTGTEPYFIDGKKSKKKCPNSHKGVWLPVELGGADGSGQPICPACNSDIEEADHYHPQHVTKNRVTLLRVVVALCDSQAENGGVQPVRLPSGKDAVELEVVVPLGRKTPAPDAAFLFGDEDPEVMRRHYGEDYELVCHFDELVTYRGRHYILDNKTTSQSIDDNTRSGRSWWQQWAPNIQIDLYDLVGSLAFPDLDIAGCAVRGLQVTRQEANVGVKLITKTEGQREEFLGDLHHWIDQAEGYAWAGHFPMNRASCKGCPFAGVCDMDPAFREATLHADFIQQPDERLFTAQEDQSAE